MKSVKCTCFSRKNLRKSVTVFPSVILSFLSQNGGINSGQGLRLIKEVDGAPSTKRMCPQSSRSESCISTLLDDMTILYKP